MTPPSSKSKSKKLKDIFSRRRREVAEDTPDVPVLSNNVCDTTGNVPSDVTSSTLDSLPLRSRPDQEPITEVDALNESPGQILTAARKHLASQGPSLPAAPGTSLWDRAYEELEKEDPELVRKYKNILLREAAEQDAESTQRSAGDPSATDGTAPTDVHRIMLQDIIKRCREQAENNQSQYTKFGRSFDPRTQLAQASELLIKSNGLISEAIKISPEASLAWAGISIILPLLTNPMTAKEGRLDGLTYVTARSKYYVQLEPHLWPVQFQQPELRDEFKNQIVHLYHRITEFLIKVVIHYHDTWVKRTSKDALLWEDWKSMIAKIQELETSLREESKIVYTAAGYDLMTETLEVAVDQNRKLDEQMQFQDQQLEVTTENLEVNKKKLATSQEAK